MQRSTEVMFKRLVPAPVRTYVVSRWGIYGVRRYAMNTFWMFAGQAAAVFTFVTNVILARTLGPETFGTLNYVLAFVGIFTVIASAGMFDSLPRDFTKSPEKRTEIIGSAAVMLVGACIIAWFTLLASLLILHEPAVQRSLILLYATIYLWFPINTIIASFFIAHTESKKIALTQITVLVTVSLLRLGLLMVTKDLTIFILTFALEPALTALNYYRQSRTLDIWRTPLRAYPATLKTLLSTSLLLVLSSGSAYLLLRIDQVLLKSFLDEVAVGYYAAAVRLSELWYFIPGLICASLLPALVNAERTDRREYINRMRHLYLALGVIAVLVAIVTSAFAHPIIHFLYGDTYLSAVPILTIYAWSTIGFFLMTGVNKQLLTERRHVAILTYSIIAVVANIGLNILLIPDLGPTGAAWATLISYALIPLLHVLFSGLNRMTILPA